MSTSTLNDVSTIIVVMHAWWGQADCLASSAKNHGQAVEVRNN
jgi:hypothetical protein